MIEKIEDDSNAIDNQSPLTIGTHVFKSRLILGSGKYQSFEVMQQSVAASGTECITIAVRREKLYDGTGRNLSLIHI